MKALAPVDPFALPVQIGAGGVEAWAPEPGVVLLLAGLALLYGRGVRRLWRSAGAGAGVRRWEAGCFAAGWAVLALALASPLDAWGALLFAAHMAQHELLIVVAAPLLVLGRPLPAFAWGVPADLARGVGGALRAAWWRRTWRAASAPLVAWGLHAAALWGWHAPALYQAALRGEAAHALQHASFFGTALLFWWAVVRGRPGRGGYGLAVLCVFATAVHNAVLGALLTFARAPWYPAYEPTAPLWGLTPLEDQQLGGLIMWVPAGVVYVVAACALVAAWLNASERHARRRAAGPVARLQGDGWAA